MNDRFKFRAKRLDNNKFVYGYLCFIYIDNEKHCRIYSSDDAMSYDCYTETLGQCTGLKDKNGKLIYEGDIVKDDVGLIAPVRFDDVNAMFYIDKYIGVDNYPFVYFYHYDTEKELEVIGNIHENADLLGEDK